VCSHFNISGEGMHEEACVYCLMMHSALHVSAMLHRNKALFTCILKIIKQAITDQKNLVL
jgi:hypothetical protein